MQKRNNKRWATELAAHLKGTVEQASQKALPTVDVAEVLKRKPQIVVKPIHDEVTYDEDDLLWAIDKRQLVVGDIVLLQREPSDQPIVVAVLDGNDPDPTKHPKGKALKAQVSEIGSQSRFWKAPVALTADLNAITTDADGTIRLLKDSDELYRWSASTATWVAVSGGGGGGATNLDALTDVTLTTPATGNFLRYNGAQWVNAPIAQSDVTSLVADLALKAPLASPALTGTPTAPTIAIGAGTNIATIGAVNTALGSYLPLAGGTMTGNLLLTRATYGEPLQVFDTDGTTKRFSVDTDGSFISILQSSSYYVWTSRVTGDTHDRLTVLADGRMEWGSGSGAADTVLYRSAANILSMGASDKLQQYVSPTVGDDLTNKTYVDEGSYLFGMDASISLLAFNTVKVLGSAGNFTEQEGVDFYVESPTNKASYNANGINYGDNTAFDWTMSRVSAGVMALDTGDKLQQNAAPTVGDDLTNKTYVDSTLDQLRRRAFMGL